jgi:hypothetical protein
MKKADTYVDWVQRRIEIRQHELLQEQLKHDEQLRAQYKTLARPKPLEDYFCPKKEGDFFRKFKKDV